MLALPAPSTTTARTINKGVFMATSLMRGPQQSKFNRGSNEPSVNDGHDPAIPTLAYLILPQRLRQLLTMLAA